MSPVGDLLVMKFASNRNVYWIGAAIGLVIFALAWDGFFWLLRELGYVDGAPASVAIATLFLACMLVMCVGYGIGLSVFVSKKTGRKRG